MVTMWFAIMPATNDDAAASPVGAGVAPPNIVLILTDDQTLDELSEITMPTVVSELVGKGVTFQNAFVSNSLCCPSRTSILTGKYSHGTGVYRNDPPYGGFETFRDEDGSTIATWLHDAPAHYATALVGKYLNGYAQGYKPPGWDRWVGLGAGDSSKGYYDYDITVDDSVVHHGSDPEDYSTDVLTGFATDFVRKVPASRPLFLYFAPHAPHDPATPPIRYSDELKDLPPYRPPNFNEADVSDKPPWVQRLPLLRYNDIKRIDDFRNRQFRSLMAVDEAVDAIMAALEETHRLGNTFIVVTSDNGLEMGSHRWSKKRVPWEESIHMPLIVRYDPLTQGTPRIDTHLALNIDLAPTFAELAGISAPGAEGTSLLPLVRGEDPPWRSDFLLEHLADAVNDPAYVPSYCGVRTQRYKYVQYEEQVGDDIEISEELYDLNADPFELLNLAGDIRYAVLKAQWHKRMVQLCSPPPPGFIP
jgi:arylsulfatase A-like enzyme